MSREEYKEVKRTAKRITFQVSLDVKPDKFKNDADAFSHFYRPKNHNHLLKKANKCSVKHISSEEIEYIVKKKKPTDHSTVATKTVKELLCRAIEAAGFKRVSGHTKHRDLKNQEFYVVAYHKDDDYEIIYRTENSRFRYCLLSLRKDKLLEGFSIGPNFVAVASINDPNVMKTLTDYWIDKCS